MKKIVPILILALTTLYAHAQTNNNTSAPVKHAQPKIMVIPRTPEGQDMKRIYDSDVNIQIAMAKINEAFQKRGANLVSFDQALKQAKENMAFDQASDNQQDFKSLVLQTSSADIYVETKLDVVSHTQRNAKSVNIILEAYQTGTSNLMSSRTVSGPMFATDDVGKLTMLAMDTVTESFLNLLQLKFDDIVENGQSVYVEFSIKNGSDYTFDSEIPNTNGKLLSEVIDDWFAAHALKGVYNNQGVVGTKMIISDVRIPLKDPANSNKNYTGSNLYTDILKYFRTLNIKIQRQIGTNNKILISIL